MKTKIEHHSGMHYCKAHIITLFNSDVLNMASANWYKGQGYALICEDGRVTDIVEDTR